MMRVMLIRSEGDELSKGDALLAFREVKNGTLC